MEPTSKATDTDIPLVIVHLLLALHFYDITLTEKSLGQLSNTGKKTCHQIYMSMRNCTDGRIIYVIANTTALITRMKRD
jgi:hypothetical protein